MSYKLISEGTGETLSLSSVEWEMLQKLAALGGGAWQPQEGRDYTRGIVSAEDASDMANSVDEALGQIRAHAGEPTEERRRRPSGAFEPWTRQEMLDHLGDTEEDPLKFFSLPHKMHRGESFVRIPSKGDFEVLPRPLEEGQAYPSLGDRCSATHRS